MSDKYRNPSRYRLDFIKENTFNRIWSVRMTRTRVVLVSLASFAAFAALIWTVFAFTPLRRLLPGTLSGDLRQSYLTIALKMDSLEQTARINNAYIANIVAIMNDELPADSAMAAAAQAVASDSLLAASELERQFVERYRREDRFNLSVLSPIAAEGMVFSSPLPTGTATEQTGGATAVSFGCGMPVPLSAVYRGTAIGAFTDADGKATVVLQHPNDFVSIYRGLKDVYVGTGAKVVVGQRIGTSGTNGASYELWHNGTALDPMDYISF